MLGTHNVPTALSRVYKLTKKHLLSQSNHLSSPHHILHIPSEDKSVTSTVKMKAWIALSFVAVALMAVVSAEPEPPAPVYGVPEIVSHDGGYGAPVSKGWAAPAPVSQGWGWRPKVRYLNLRIPIPQLPKIRLGIRAGIKASVSHGWGWQK